MYALRTHFTTLLLLVVVGAVGCRKERATKTTPASPRETTAAAPLDPDTAPDSASSEAITTLDGAGSWSEEEEIDFGALLDRATTRQSCNIVMGCPAGEKLIAIGEDAVAPIIARYKTLGRPNYQKFHLIDLLGQIGSENALPLLREELDANHWESRSRSALALGRIGARRDLARLREHLSKTEGTQDYAFLYALAYAVEKLDGKGGAKILLDGLSPQSINSRNWGYTRVAVEAVAELNLVDACPRLRLAVEHRDTFLKKSAVVAAGALNCQDAALIRAIAAQLPSRVPSVRRQAQETLNILTGITFTNFEQWKNYSKEDSAAASP